MSEQAKQHDNDRYQYPTADHSDSSPVGKSVDMGGEKLQKSGEKEVESKRKKDHLDSKQAQSVDDMNDSPSPWKQYTEGDRNDWHKYLSKPGSNGTDDGTQFDWMKYAAPYMNSNGSSTGNDSQNGSFDWQKYAGQYMGGESANNSTSTQWNNGQGDGFGEPFRSQTGGDFRYKAGRQWDNNTSGGGDGGFDWQKFAAPYSNVNPSQPGTENQASGNNSSAMDWHKYSSGGNGGDFDWHQYADKYMSGGNGGQGGDQSSGNDWQKYAAPYMGGQSGGSATDKNPAAQVQTGAASGGYFEVEVSGTNLNVTTTFGLGQGKAANGTADASSEAGGGGGQQTFMTADEGRIFLRGNFLNKLDPNVVPA